MKLVRILILPITCSACAREEPAAIVVQTKPGSQPTTAPQATPERHSSRSTIGVWACVRKPFNCVSW